MSKVFSEWVLKTEELCSGVFRMIIKSDEIASTARPGQFVNIKCGGMDAFLRRPISICDVDREQGTFTLVIQVKGKGTELLCHGACEKVDILAPLGKPFHIDSNYKKVCVVGGGIGTFPLLYLLKSMPDSKRTALLGFRTKAAVVLEDEFSSASEVLRITTDDGSNGTKAFVTELLEKAISEDRPDIIYTCGPSIMIQKVAKIAEANGIPCQVSMEQRMGCGIGACLVCACKTKKGDDFEYSHVCKDGPVFWSTDVCWE